MLCHFLFWWKRRKNAAKTERSEQKRGTTILELQFLLQISQSRINELTTKITELESRLWLPRGNSSFSPSHDIAPPPKPGNMWAMIWISRWEN
jgi:hypothetical protein